MSLAELRAVRIAGQRPDSVIVVIGPANLDDGPDMVQVSAGDDLRPLIGLPVHLFDLAGDTRQTLAIIRELAALNVKPLGVCGPAGACGVSPEHERCMERFREVLCLS
jgi:hypothetical protein